MTQVMDWLHYILNGAPEIALFAALALGHGLGRLKFGNFSLGGVAGSLLVGLVIGQLTGVVMPEALKAVCFALFIYSVGFKSGPEFFGGLNRSSLKLVLFSVVQCLAALATIFVLARVCRFGKGFAAGLGAGALTQTAKLGTPTDALKGLGLAPEEISRLGSQMAVGFAITYVFGTVGVIVFVRSVVPRLLGVDMKQTARELEVELSEGGQMTRPGYIKPFVPVVARAFTVEANGAARKTMAELQRCFDRATIERIMRGREALELAPALVLEAGDVIGVTGRLGSVVAAGGLIGNEVENEEALSFPMKVVSVVFTDKRIAGKTLQQLRDSFSEAELEGVYVLSLKRQGLPLPILLKTRISRGDVLELAGRPDDVDRVANRLGRAESPDGRSDLAYHALAIVAGTLIGLITVKAGGIPVTLGVGGGVLVSGLCFGWLHTRYPVLGALPQPAQWILSEFGLSAFAGAIGLSAGPKALAAIQQQGVALLLAGAAVTIIPLIVALYFGRFALKLHPVVLLGALCGGQTVAAALSAANEEAGSMTPVLGFTVTYAISNVLLAVWGPVIVAFT